MIDIPTGRYKVIRSTGKVTWENGRPIKGTETFLDISASIQPVSGNMIKIIPEHRRNQESIVIYSSDRLFTTDEKSGRIADVVEYDGKRFQVFSVKKWAETTDINHYESIAIMEDGQGGANEY